MELSRRYKNAVFEILRDNRVNPADCDLDLSGKAARLLHNPTGSSFSFVDHGNFWVIDFLVEDGPNHVGLRAEGWRDLVEQLYKWAGEVYYVTEHPDDLWAELRQVPEVMGAAQAADASTAPFTSDEQAEIGRRLDEVKQSVREQFELTSEQFATIDQRLDDAKEAAKHTDRKTWLYTFYGAVMSTFMTDEIPPHVIQNIVATVVHGIAHMFGLGGPPPGIGG